MGRESWAVGGNENGSGRREDILEDLGRKMCVCFGGTNGFFSNTLSCFFIGLILFCVDDDLTARSQSTHTTQNVRAQIPQLLLLDQVPQPCIKSQGSWLQGKKM